MKINDIDLLTEVHVRFYSAAENCHAPKTTVHMFTNSVSICWRINERCASGYPCNGQRARLGLTKCTTTGARWAPLPLPSTAVVVPDAVRSAFSDTCFNHLCKARKHEIMIINIRRKILLVLGFGFGFLLLKHCCCLVLSSGEFYKLSTSFSIPENYMCNSIVLRRRSPRSCAVQCTTLVSCVGYIWTVHDSQCIVCEIRKWGSNVQISTPQNFQYKSNAVEDILKIGKHNRLKT